MIEVIIVTWALSSAALLCSIGNNYKLVPYRHDDESLDWCSTILAGPIIWFVAIGLSIVVEYKKLSSQKPDNNEKPVHKEI